MPRGAIPADKCRKKRYKPYRQTGKNSPNSPIFAVMGKKAKYYTVWVGQQPCVYNSWTECQLQVKGYEGARYKSFDSLTEARQALADGPDAYLPSRQAVRRPSAAPRTDNPLPPEGIQQALVVDAACSGNPGPMEYRGVYLPGGQEIFHFGPVYGTNNIGEFLAIVHALALMEMKNYRLPVYSDSANALSWVQQKKCKTKLERNARTEELFRMIERAEQWLRTHTYTVPVLKWDTRRWGEIPADFGRK